MRSYELSHLIRMTVIHIAREFDQLQFQSWVNRRGRAIRSMPQPTPRQLEIARKAQSSRIDAVLHASPLKDVQLPVNTFEQHGTATYIVNQELVVIGARKTKNFLGWSRRRVFYAWRNFFRR